MEEMVPKRIVEEVKLDTPLPLFPLLFVFLSFLPVYEYGPFNQKLTRNRLSFHLYIRDAQVSMTSMNNPHMSYAEMTLPLPEARELWFAKTAQEWKMHYLERYSEHNEKPPSLCDLLRDVNLLATHHHRLDVQYAASIFLHGFSSLIREYRQMNAIYRWSNFSPTTTSNPNMLLQSRHVELVKTLEQFQLQTAQSWPHVLSAQEKVVLSLLLMNLHVSLEDLQLFSGKEGDDQARRIYPALKRWVQEPESRRAIWHAGQILRWAREFPLGHLKDFYAIAVHQAAMTLWTWGVVTRALRRNDGLPREYNNQNEPKVYLDGPHSAQTHQFVGQGTGRPAVQCPVKKDDGHSRRLPGVERSHSSGGVVSESFVDEPVLCMSIVEEILRANFLDGPTVPIVENLCHLITQLGKAAGAVGLS